MASSFESNDWIKKLLASQDAVQRALKPYRQTHLLGMTVHSQQLEQMRAWANDHNERLVRIMDQARRVLDSPARQLQHAQEQLDRIVRPYDIASELRKFVKFTEEVEESYRQALPVNWRPLTFEDAGRASALTHDEGVPLVWVPGPDLTAEVCEKVDRDEAMAFLVEEQARVLSDIEATLAELVEADLAEWAGKVQEAIDAYRDGHTSPAQALAAAVITAGLERGMRFKKLQDVRKLADRLSPDEVELALYRTSLVVQLGSRCVQGTGFEKPGFNRGASLHEVSDDQYNSENSIAAIMIAASILREAQELRQSEMVVSNDGESSTTSNGGAPSD